MPSEDETAELRRKAERLATLASLARPVQHEINNLLTVIFANLEMLKRKAAEGAPQRQLDRIHEAARRFEASSRAILSLSRRPVPGGSVFPLAEAVAALGPLLRVLLPAPGAFSLSLAEPPDEGWVVCRDRALLDEALVGLAKAALAAEPQGIGILTLGVANGPGEGERDRVRLSVRLEGVAPLAAAPALARLRAVAEAAGGTVQAAERGGLLLDLPRHEAGMPGPGG